MATSIGGAAAQGIESGLGMGLRLFDQQEQIRSRQQREQEHATDRQERRADRDLQNQRALKQDERLAAQDARLVKHDERQQWKDQLGLIDSEIGGIKTEGEGYIKQYGGFDKIPPELRDDWVARARTKRGERNSIRSKFFQPSVLDQKKQAAETWSRITAGQLSVDDIKDPELVQTLTVQTRRDMKDFLDGPDGKPGPIRQAAMDFEAGLKTGNQDLVLKGANVLFAPELKTGIGQDGPDGNEIIGKEIVQLVPHPQDPSKVVPLLKVTVRRDDGAIGSYIAPVTENRSSDPNDNIRTVDMSSGFDRVGQLTTLVEAVNRPDVRKRVEAGLKEAGDGPQQFLQQLYGIGGTMPQSKVKRETRDLGSHLEVDEVDEATGRVLGTTVHRKGATPRQPGEGSQEDAKVRSLRAALSRGEITAEQYQKGLERHLLGGGGASGMESPKAQFEAENKLRDEHTKQSGTFVKIRDAYGKTVAAATNPSAAGDIALIFGYMKMLDPESVVREGEFATAQNAASIPDRVRNEYNKALEGTRLNDDQRKDLVNQAKKVYAEQKKGQNRLDKNYTELAHRYGLDAANVVQQFDLETAPPPLPAAVSAQLKEGHVTTFRNGQRWTLQGGEPVQVK